MSNKEELIDWMQKNLKQSYRDRFITKEQALHIYDEIRASILMPKVVALLKAIGSKPKNCFFCKLNKIDESDINTRTCRLGFYCDICPLLSSEELAETTGGDR